MIKTKQKSSQSSFVNNRDSVENDTENSLGDFGSSMVKNIGKSFKDIGTGVAGGVFDAMTGYDSSPDLPWGNEQYPKLNDIDSSKAKRVEHKNVFNSQNLEDRRQIEAITELIKQIKQEVQLIKKQDRALLSEVKDIEKLTLESLPEKPGIYHVRFLEVLLKILQSLRAKIGESSTWMQALISKKKKRGSLFAVHSKEKGTQYSLSQELQSSRSVQ